MAVAYPSRSQASVDPAILELLKQRLQLQDPARPGRTSEPFPTGDVNAPRADPERAALGPSRSSAPVVDVTKFDFGDRGDGRNPAIPPARVANPTDYPVATPPGPSGVGTAPARVNVDVGEPPPVPEPKFITDMERVSREMPQPSYSQAHVNKYDGTITGLTYPNRNPEIPAPRAIEPMDSVVVAPDGPTTAPGNPPPVKLGLVPRKAGESENDYQSRLRRTFRDELRNASPYSKVTKTGEGVDVAPPVKPSGFKGRGRAGLAMGSRMIQAGKPYGLAGMAGSSIAGILTGIFAPGLESKYERADQIAAAEREVATDEEQAGRDQQARMREIQMQEAEAMPGRREDATKEAQRDNLRAIWASLPEFDPASDAEHKRLQTEASLLGIFLPSKAAKPTRSTGRTGLLANAKTVADASGNKIYVSEETGQPIPDPADPTGKTPLYADRADSKAEAPNLIGDYSNRVAQLQKLIEDDEREMRMHSANLNTKQRTWEKEARRRMDAAQAKDKKGDTIEGKRNFKDWLDIVKTDDPDYVSVSTDANEPKVDYSARTRDEMAERVKENKAELTRLRGELRTQQEKPRLQPGRSKGGAYSGRTIPLSSVQAWATARNMPIEQAKALFMREGATIQ